MRVLGTITLVLAVASVVSCSRPARMKLYNHSGFDITIVSSRSDIEIANGQSSVFMFPAETSALMIQVDSTAWEYEMPYPPREYCDPTAASVIHAQLEPGGRLYVFLPNTQFPVTDLSLQPDGFPLEPRIRKG